jgi:ABC-type transport system involved in cytochrome c biogenesis permease component
VIGRLTTWHVRWLVAHRGVLATALVTGGSVALAALLALHDADQAALAAGATLWLVPTVGGLASAARLVAAEAHDGGLEVALLAPVDRRDVFLARALAASGLVLLLALLAGVATAAVFPELAGLRDPRGLVPLAVGALGLGPLGTLAGFAALSARAGELLAPAVALPVAAPLLVTGLHATLAVVEGGRLATPSLTFALGYAAAVAGLSYGVSRHVAEAPP